MSVKKDIRKSSREELKKKHAITPVLMREEASREAHKHILIVSEGTHTEPSYFDQFKEPGLKIITIGLGKGTRKLVSEVEAHKVIEEKKLKGKSFDEIWVVFDKDSFEDFEQAIEDALAKGYKVAYSNQAIEYWFILHLEDHQGGGMDRKDYAQKLNSLLSKLDSKCPLTYDQNSKIVSEELFNVFHKHIQLAYDRAERIFKYKSSRGKSKEESVTTIHQLVHSITGITTSSERLKERNKRESKRKAGLL